MTSVQVYSHGFDRTSSIQRFLDSILPYGIPLQRRIQHPRRSQNLSLLLASFPPEKLPQEGEAFTVLFWDPAEPRSTEAWLFTSLELGTLGVHSEAGPLNPLNDHQTLVRSQLVAAFQHARRHWDTVDHGSLVVKVGNTHERTAEVMRCIGNSSDQTTIVLDAIAGKGGPYQKQLFLSTSTGRKVKELPPGLTFDTAKDGDYESVVASSHFVHIEFLKGLAHTAAREAGTGMIVAWAFMGPDGGTRTVHCEPQWRGKGVAAAIVDALIRQDVRTAQLVDGKEHNKRLQQADVAENNIPSMALFKSFDCSYAWDVYWLTIDLGKLPEIGQGVQGP